MKLYNDTPFAVSRVVSKLEPGQPFLSLVVKGVFALVPDGVCLPLEKDQQPGLGKPEHFEDEHGNSLKTDSDVAAFKPRADCLFVGSGFAPEGRATPALEVTFGVGGMRKKLVLHGDRYWVRTADGAAVLTEPEPFVEMPVREEYAHGGPHSIHNRHGIGFGDLGPEAGSRIRAANVLDTEFGALPWNRDMPSAGFGAVSPTAETRRALGGTYDADWLYRRRPLPPRDFDMAFFNSARPDQQIEGYLSGDEEILLENLHPTIPILRSRLPGIAVRCFAHRIVDLARPDDFEFAEVATNLDTCIVDTSAGTVTLIWRGTLGVVSEKHERIHNMMVVQEPLDRPSTREAYHERLHLKTQPSAAQLRAQEKAAAAQEQVKDLNARGLAEILDTLRKGGAPDTLIAEVEKQESVDGALKVMTEHLEAVGRTLPGYTAPEPTGSAGG